MKHLKIALAFAASFLATFSAPIRPKDSPAASAPAADDKILIDGATNGVRALDGQYSRARANHTGTQSADTITDGTTNKAYTATEKTKLAAITGTNTGDQTTVSGNAGTATTLQTARLPP